MPGLAPFAFAVRSDRDLLIMDTRADTYALIVDAIDDGSPPSPAAPLDMNVTTTAANMLADAGLLVEGHAIRLSALDPPRTRFVAETIRPFPPTSRDIADLAICMFRTQLRSKRGLPCRAYRRTRSEIPADPRRLEPALRGIIAARIILPTPMRCLPRSIIMSLFLRRRGIHSEIVFGVRSHPFAAHCWVEAGGALIDDDPDRVGAYHPICVAEA